MEPVRSIRNPRVTEAVRLRRARVRRDSGLTLVEGPNLWAEARAGGAEFVTVFSTEPPEEDVRGVDWVVVTADVLRHLSDTVTPQGPVAVIRIPPLRECRRDHLIVDVNDPGNAGTLIRTAAAFGLDVAFSEGAVDPWSPKVLRSAAGGHFRTTIGASAADCGRIATVVQGGVPAHRLSEVLDRSRTWALLVGSEAHGLGAEEIERADVRVTIPMPGGTESLNAAVAGAIVAYEFSRWRADDGAAEATR